MSINAAMGLLVGLLLVGWTATMAYIYFKHLKNSPSEELRPGREGSMSPLTGRKPETACSREEETRERRT